MKTSFAALAVWLLIVAPAGAHRLDEFLQATTIGLERDRVTVQMRLTPGVEVFLTALADIGADADGVVSPAEQRKYAERVAGDLSLTVNGNRLSLRLVSSSFPKVEEMEEGLGEILLRFEADVPRSGPAHRLIFENHHQSRIAAYLVNCLLPSDPDLRVTAQTRNFEQSFYELDYTQAGVDPEAPSVASARSDAK